ncbi:MAG: sugar phosphate isomerase/epimerase [Clostridia bacterium]|nr:sugar phosphate isomerase/epimerase [Clostridia bacterium]
MKKGISIWSFGNMSVEETLKLAKKAGFDGVELALNMTGEASLESDENEWKKIKKMADDVGISLYSVACGLYWDYSLTSDDENERKKAEEIVKKEIDMAKALGCESCLIVPGTVCADFVDPNKVVDYSTAYERSLEFFSRIKTYAENAKVEIGLENVWNKFLVSPLEMRDFIDKIGSDYVGSYLDIGNVLYNGYPEHWIKALGKRIKKVHFKDYRKVAGGLHGFVDLLAGDVNYPAVVDALKSVGYDGWVTAEMIPNYNTYNEVLIYNTSNAMDKILGRK